MNKYKYKTNKQELLNGQYENIFRILYLSRSNVVNILVC